MASGGKVFLSQLLPQHLLLAHEEAEKAELDAIRNFVANDLIESLLRCSRFAQADKDKKPMNTQYDNDKFIECPREEATHVYFAGNAHLIAAEKRDVYWCSICGECFHFYAPGKNNSSFYTAWYPGDAPASTQGPVFLKEKELEVGFEWSNYPRGMLAAEIAGVTIALVVFPTQCIRKYNDPGDPNAIHFDDYWTIRQIKDAAADYARKIVRGEA